MGAAGARRLLSWLCALSSSGGRGLVQGVLVGAELIGKESHLSSGREFVPGSCHKVSS